VAAVAAPLAESATTIPPPTRTSNPFSSSQGSHSEGRNFGRPKMVACGMPSFMAYSIVRSEQPQNSAAAALVSHGSDRLVTLHAPDRRAACKRRRGSAGSSASA
jgi:hypothetical protein